MKQHGFTSSWRSAEQGFTLVEVVVALFIFAMLAAAGVALLSFAVRAQAASSVALERVADDRRATALLIGDLGQAIPRVTRDADGEGRPAFQAEQGDLVISYVRGGARPQYIQILRDGDRIVRAASARTDGGESGTQLVLAEGLERIEVRFRAADEWVDRWTPSRTDELPRAIELITTKRGQAPLSRKFLVGAGL